MTRPHQVLAQASRLGGTEDARLARYRGPLVRWQSAAGEHNERTDRAFAVLARAHRAEGTPEERLAAYRQGISDIVDIADETDDDSEQDAICGYHELLATLIAGIEYDQQRPESEGGG